MTFTFGSKFEFESSFLPPGAVDDVVDAFQSALKFERIQRRSGDSSETGTEQTGVGAG
jgi:hypothetical protein